MVNSGILNMAILFTIATTLIVSGMIGCTAPDGCNPCGFFTTVGGILLIALILFYSGVYYAKIY